MTLTPRERAQRALRREPVDWLPTQINYTHAMGENLAMHLGVSRSELPDRFGNHLIRVDLTYLPQTSEDGRIAYDWWDAGWSKEQAGDRCAVHELCAALFVGACDLYEICSLEMKAMMEAMLGAPGVVGARQAGAGFGGCMVAFAEAVTVRAFEDHVRRTYAATTGITPEVFPVQAAPGAGKLLPT